MTEPTTDTLPTKGEIRDWTLEAPRMLDYLLKVHHMAGGEMGILDGPQKAAGRLYLLRKIKRMAWWQRLLLPLTGHLEGVE